MNVFRAFILFSFSIGSTDSYAQDYFNPLFLGSDVASLDDLSFLSEGNSAIPGVYYLDLYVSGNFVSNIKIKFIEADSITKKTKPCFTTEIVNLLPLYKNTIKKIKKENINSEQCIELEKYVNGLDYQVDMAKLTLKLSIPQIYLDSTHSTLADVKDWDNGIPVFITNYDLSGNNTWNKNEDNYSTSYFSFNNRLNYGAWRLNGNVYWNQSHYPSQTYNESSINNVFAMRPIQHLRSNLTIGQSSLGSNIFDSLPYIGVTIATSEEMRPESERGYSPPIRGIADSRSKLTIRQNGVIIYQTWVDAGPYDINDLNPVGSSGDYEVELMASDGSVKNFIIPYSTLPNLLKSGIYNYSATVGQLDFQAIKKIRFLQGSASLGLSHQTTFYAGTQLTNDYRSVGAGLAKDLGGIGAVSVDTINSFYDTPDDEQELGQSYRILYAKSFQDLGTSIQISGYRYSTSNFYTLNESVYKNSNRYVDPLSGEYSNYNLSGRRKASYQWNISQNLNEYGQISLWGNTTDYWGGESSKNIQASWNKTINAMNGLMVSLSYNKYQYEKTKNDLIFFSLTFPLSDRKSSNVSYVSNSLTFNKEDKSYNNSTNLYGTALNNKIDYNISQVLNKNHENNTTYLSGNYKSDYTRIRSGVTYSPVTTQVNYGLSGSILAHKEGVVFAKQASDTAILIEAKGADGAIVNRAGDNITIDKNGYALIPYATPYHYNSVELDPITFGDNFDVDSKVIKVAPTRGAISKVIFDVKKGYNFLVSVKYKDKAIRFGTIVTKPDNNDIAIANDDGTVYLTGVKNNSVYSVKWSDDTTCKFTIRFGDTFTPKKINKTLVKCQ